MVVGLSPVEICARRTSFYLMHEGQNFAFDPSRVAETRFFESFKIKTHVSK